MEGDLHQHVYAALLPCSVCNLQAPVVGLKPCPVGSVCSSEHVRHEACLAVQALGQMLPVSLIPRPCLLAPRFQ